MKKIGFVFTVVMAMFVVLPGVVVAQETPTEMRVLDEYDISWFNSALISNCLDIMSEDPGTANHTERIWMAKEILSLKAGYIVQMREAVVAFRRAAGDNPLYFAKRDGVTGGYNFAQMKNQIASVFDSLAISNYERAGIAQGE